MDALAALYGDVDAKQNTGTGAGTAAKADAKAAAPTADDLKNAAMALMTKHKREAVRAVMIATLGADTQLKDVKAEDRAKVIKALKEAEASDTAPANPDSGDDL